MPTKIEEPELSDLDLMLNYITSLDAKDPSDWSDKDIDVVIEYERRARANREAGIKPKRAKAEGVVKLTLADLGYKKTPSANTITRRL